MELLKFGEFELNCNNNKNNDKTMELLKSGIYMMNIDQFHNNKLHIVQFWIGEF